MMYTHEYYACDEECERLLRHASVATIDSQSPSASMWLQGDTTGSCLNADRLEAGDVADSIRKLAHHFSAESTMVESNSGRQAVVALYLLYKNFKQDQ